MPICAPGISQPKAIAPAVAFLSGEAAVAAAVEFLSLPASWIALLAYAAGQTFTVSTLCASDPPAMPTFSALDIAAIITGNASVSPAAFAKLNTLIQIGAWFAFCECTQAVVPTVPPPPTYPPTGAVINPPGFGQLPNPPCATTSYSAHYSATPGGAGPLYTSFLLPKIAQPVGLDTTYAGIPAGVTAVTVTATVTPSAALSADFLWYIDTTNVTPGSEVRNNLFTFPTGTNAKTTLTATIAVPTTATAWEFETLWGSPTPAMDVSWTFQEFCGGSGAPSTAQSCCPPDPTLAAAVSSILNMLNLIYQGLPTAVNSLADSTVHSGLSGSQTVALVQECVAVRVDVDAFPTTQRTSAESPTFYWDVGFITPIIETYPQRGSRIVYATQLFFVPVLTDSIGVNLKPGVTAHLTEIVRGP